MSRALGRSQVFDVHLFSPALVLEQMWSRMEEAIETGDPAAEHTQQRLRIVVAGGDGTVAWVLGAIQQLRIEPHPRVAIIPLGTGNDLSRVFGWGKIYHPAWVRDYHSLYRLMERVQVGRPSALDCWRVCLQASGPGVLDAKSLPYSLQRVEGDGAGSQGLFWNYLSVGLDAYSAYGFHRVREGHPALARARLTNQLWYTWFSLKSGWLCGARGLRSTYLRSLAVRRESADWAEVPVPADVRALVFLNIDSYAGGRNIWGRADGAGFGPQSCSDGLLEVVGLRGGLHSAAVMASRGKLAHGRRLAQASAVRIELGCPTEEGTSKAYLQVDGEPWRQKLAAGQSLILLVERKGEPPALAVALAGTAIEHHRQRRHEPDAGGARQARAAVHTQAAAAAAAGPHGCGTARGRD